MQNNAIDFIMTNFNNTGELQYLFDENNAWIKMRKIKKCKSFVYILDRFITFFKNNFEIDLVERNYILYLILSNKLSFTLYETMYDENLVFKDIICNIFINNHNKVEEYLKRKLDLNDSFTTLKEVINNRKCNVYFLFDDFKNFEIDYYANVWNEIISHL